MRGYFFALDNEHQFVYNINARKKTTENRKLVRGVNLTCHGKSGTIQPKQRSDILMKKYLVSTSVEGHLYGNYSTERLLSKQEAIEVLSTIREIDPNAKLVRVVEERREEFGDK